MNNFEYKYISNQRVFRYAKGKSLMRGDEIHSYYEILYYMGGDACLLTEKFETAIQENSLIIIPKECYHKFKITNQENYTRLCLNFPVVVESQHLYQQIFTDIKIVSPNSYIKNNLHRIIEVLKNPDCGEFKENLLNSALSMLLVEIAVAPLVTQPILRQDEQLITKCIKYIEKHLRDDISIPDISNEMAVSPSTLHLCFKEHLGISVYKYITEKRLILAYKLISDGKKPTKIYKLCGYNDYPTFYKAYKKKFGTEPAKQNEQFL